MAKARFTQAQITRAIRSVQAAGLTITAVEIDADGTVRIRTDQIDEADDADAALQRWRDERDASDAKKERACRAAFERAAKERSRDGLDGVFVGRPSITGVELCGFLGISFDDLDTAQRIGLLQRAHRGGVARFTVEGICTSLGWPV